MTDVEGLVHAEGSYIPVHSVRHQFWNATYRSMKRPRVPEACELHEEAAAACISEPRR